MVAVEQDRIDYCFTGIPSACRNVWPRGTASTGPAGSSSSVPSLGTFFVAFNHDRPAFKGPGQIPLEKAINYAIDRPEIARTFGYLGAKRTDQLLPPALARPVSIYPLEGADPATARKWLARATIKPSTLVLYADNTSQGVAIAQTLVYNLKQIGIDVQVKYFFVTALAAKVATRGEPFDLALSGWIADYADPASFFVPLLYRGSGAQGVNLDDPRVDRRDRGGEPPDRRGAAQGLGRPRHRPDARQPTLGAAREQPDPHVRLSKHGLRAPSPALQLRHRRRLQEVAGHGSREADLDRQLARALPQLVGAGAGAELVRPRGRAVEVGDGLRDVPTLRVVVREPLEIVAERSRVELLEGRRYEPVELSTPPGRERRQRRLLEEAVPEGAHELGVATHLAHDLGTQERREIVARAVSGDTREDRHRELSSEHRRDLCQQSRSRGQPIDPRDEEALERGREQERRPQGHRPGAMRSLEPSRLEECRSSSSR